MSSSDTIRQRKKILSKNAAQTRKQSVAFLRKRPISSLLVAFILLVVAIVASLAFKSPQEETAHAEVQPMHVQAVRFGDGDVSEDTVGTIENKSTLTLVAQSAGPVSEILVDEGESVWTGSVILRQNSAYAAGNAATVQRQIAAENYQLAAETLDNTVQTVSKTREQADKVKENTDELRKISEKSVEDTEGFISRLETQYDQLEDLVDSTSSAVTQTSFRASLISTQNFLNQSRASLRQLQYETDTDNPPTKLAELQRDLIYLSTEIQLKSAEIQKNIAGLNLQAAKIAEAATRVASPLEGTVQRLLVSEGEYVTPGTPVAVITGDPQLQLVIGVSGNLAKRVDREQMLTAEVNERVISLPIHHVSSVPVSGQLFEVIASVPEAYAQQVYENQSLQVTLPLYSVSVIGGNYYIPLDSVFITNTDTFVYVEKDGVAVKQPIEIGSISGSLVEVLSGLVPGDVIILDRAVIEGQPVEVEFVPSTSTTVIEELG